jgi:hypothetical protein
VQTPEGCAKQIKAYKSKSNSSKSTASASNQNKLKSAFVEKSAIDRKSIQSNLSKLGFYKSSIDGLYGKGTAAALKAYNKEYLGDAELTKTANVNALLTDVLKPKSIGELAVKCKDEPKNCYTGELCNKATYRGPSGDLKWSAIYENHVKEARSRGLSCLVKEDKDIAENAKDDAPEPTSKLDIAQVQASYEAKDFTKAFADAQVLAVQGDPEAQLLLGKMFADGRGTLQVSTVAHMWFNIASMGGIDEAYEDSAKL